MTVKSQLEVYRIILPSKTTYGELIQGKFYDENSPKQTDIIKFKKLYKSFLEKLVKNNVWVYKEKKKGLTVFLEKGEQINQIITSHPNQYIIEGYLDGGRYDMIRKMAAMSADGRLLGNALTDSIRAVEEYLIDEMALETCFEGYRFGDLMRISQHRGEDIGGDFENDFLARRVATRETAVLNDKVDYYRDMDMDLYNKLLGTDSKKLNKAWFLVLPDEK